MDNPTFYIPKEDPPDFKNASSLKEANNQQAEFNEKLRKETIWICECGKANAIKDTQLIQTYFYVSPHGCTGGDYWLPGEKVLLCECGNRSRLYEYEGKQDWNNKKLPFLASDCAKQFTQHGDGELKEVAQT